MSLLVPALGCCFGSRLVDADFTLQYFSDDEESYFDTFDDDLFFTPEDDR